MKILIIGAGIGGLTAAIALARNGHVVEVYEAASSIEEAGAGLTLGYGAQHVFRALDLQTEVAARACPSTSPPYLHFQTGQLLMGTVDTGDGAPDDGASNQVRQIHRADLQTVLLGAATDAGVRIFSGHRLESFEQESHAVTARFADGSTASGDLLVGADGVRSQVRALMVPDDQPRFTGHIAFRFLVPIKRAQSYLGQGRTAVYVGNRRTFTRYTMSMGRLINVVGLVETEQETPEGWSQPASVEEMQAAFAGWHADVLGLIGQARDIRKWGLFERAPLDSWTRGRVTMLGDAAHAMLPFLGLGAAMAVEDAWVLARSLELDGEDWAAALRRYESARLPRTRQISEASRRQGEVTQAINPDAFGMAEAPLRNHAMMEFDPVAALG